MKIIGDNMMTKTKMRKTYDVAGFSRIRAIALLNVLFLLKNLVDIKAGEDQNNKEHDDSGRRSGAVIDPAPHLIDDIEAQYVCASGWSALGHRKDDINGSESKHTGDKEPNKGHTLDQGQCDMPETTDAVGSIDLRGIIELCRNTLDSGQNKNAHKGNANPGISDNTPYHGQVGIGKDRQRRIDHAQPDQNIAEDSYMRVKYPFPDKARND